MDTETERDRDRQREKGETEREGEIEETQREGGRERAPVLFENTSRLDHECKFFLKLETGEVPGRQSPVLSTVY